jgi:hypothetical protein
MTKIIELTVSPAGETRLETKGFTGSSCQASSEFLEKALGIRQTEQLTAEFHTNQTSQSLVQEGRR